MYFQRLAAPRVQKGIKTKFKAVVPKAEVLGLALYLTNGEKNPILRNFCPGRLFLTRKFHQRHRL
jgi:hypothetical protein